MNVNLHIERLVLDGLALPHADRPVLQAVLEAELGRLLAEGGLSPALQGGGARPELPAGEIDLAPGGDPAQLGAQIARAVYAGLGA